jgi:hypothetical protein
MNEIFQNLQDFAPSRKTSLIVATAAATTFIFSGIIKKKLSPVPKPIILSPRATLLPNLSNEEKAALPYPPDLFPGARDVGSPVYFYLISRVSIYPQFEV